MTTPTPQTGHTGQKAKQNRVPWFEMAQDAEKQWHWCLWSTNGRAIALNPQGFLRRNDCAANIQAVREAMKRGDSPIVIAHEPHRRIRGPNSRLNKGNINPELRKDDNEDQEDQKIHPQTGEAAQSTTTTPSGKSETTGTQMER